MNHNNLPAARVLAVLAVSGLTTLTLHQLGRVPWLSIDWAHPLRWLNETPPSEALLSIARLLGLGCGWWILLSTFCYITAGLCRMAAGVRLMTPITPPFVRSLAARAMVGAVAVSTLGNAVAAAASPDRTQAPSPSDPYPVPMVVQDSPPAAPVPKTGKPTRLPVPLPWLPPTGTPVTPSETAEKPAGPITDRPALSPTSLKPGKEYRVAPGDHLWDIARRTLAREMDRPPSTRQITSYWVELIEANRESIRSHDPNLIYPGERILLPELGDL